MRFGSPLFLLLLLLIPLLIYLELRKRPGTVQFSNIAFLKANDIRGKSLRFAILVLNCLVLLLIILALARPQKGRVFQEVESQGVDIMLCLDISGSMQAEDFSPKNRLFVAKERAKEFIAKRKGDRIGLVVFSALALTQCPLTLNREILNNLIDRVTTGIVPDGTAIGMGIATAVARLENSQAKNRLIILLTDGLNNAGEIDPITAAKTAQSLGIKIYTIGVGSEGEVPYPVDDPIFGRRYVRVKIDLDMKTLQEIAAITGGKSFLATDANALKTIYDEIDRMEPSTFKVKQHTVYSERANLFTIPSLVLLLAILGLSLTVLRRIP
ncbi:MAG: VWA domain-containing protein [candidate division WOR-3 bacterium]